jgi:GalNAc-alpha-(1->4)-GalNAc-alpha-(1->3)-diNAcBac-PP-undecaprenol alpha-1,4-N-acetyl-D-galactosaminyltransferase
MKITLVIYSLFGGGAERVATNKVNYWVERGWDVTLLTWSAPTAAPAYHLDERVKLQQLDLARESRNWFEGLAANLWRLPRLREAILATEPDVAIGLMNSVNVTTIMATRGTGIPTIVCEHTYPGWDGDRNAAWSFLMSVTYKMADRVTVLTQNALPFYPSSKGYRTVVMPNPVLTPQLAPQPESLLPPNTIVAVGRLNQIKGFDLLITAFARIRDRFPDWQLYILGEGRERSALETLTTELGLQGVVHLPGRVDNVNDYLAQAELFVMSSRGEGFPMALCEAMAVGLPAISFDCLSGPADIIIDGVDGLLIPPEDVDALARSMADLLADPDRRHKLATNAPKVLDRFGVERVMQMWSDLIKQVVNRSS